MASNFQQAYEEILYVSITVFASLKNKASPINNLEEILPTGS